MNDSEVTVLIGIIIGFVTGILATSIVNSEINKSRIKSGDCIVIEASDRLRVFSK